MIQLYLGLALAACVAGGGFLVWHGIGASAVAKHEEAVKVQQDKIMAVAKAKTDATAEKLVDMQAAYEAGQADVGVKTKIVYLKAKDYVAAEPVFKLADCVVPQTGMDELNRVRGQQAARIIGMDAGASVSLTESKTVEPKKIPFPDPLPIATPVPSARQVTNPLAEHPKPVPLK